MTNMRGSEKVAQWQENRDNHGILPLRGVHFLYETV